MKFFRSEKGDFFLVFTEDSVYLYCLTPEKFLDDMYNVSYFDYAYTKKYSPPYRESTVNFNETKTVWTIHAYQYERKLLGLVPEGKIKISITSNDSGIYSKGNSAHLTFEEIHPEEKSEYYFYKDPVTKDVIFFSKDSNPFFTQINGLVEFHRDHIAVYPRGTEDILFTPVSLDKKLELANCRNHEFPDQKKFSNFLKWIKENHTYKVA